MRRLAASSWACGCTCHTPSMAAEGHATWSLLSRACHHHPYDLQPSRDEVLAWIDAAERFHALLQTAGHDIVAR